jgi:hypothetical protein
VSDDDLIVRLRAVTSALSELHIELSTVRQAEAQQRASIIRDTQSTSVSALDRSISVHVVDLTCDIVRLQGEIAAQREEKDYLLACLGVT